MKYIINRILFVIIVILTFSFIAFSVVYFKELNYPMLSLMPRYDRDRYLLHNGKLSLEGTLTLLAVYVPLLILYFVTSDAPQKKFSDEYVIKSSWD